MTTPADIIADLDDQTQLPGVCPDCGAPTQGTALLRFFAPFLRCNACLEGGDSGAKAKRLSFEEKRELSWREICPSPYRDYDPEKLKPAAKLATAKIKALGSLAEPRGLVLTGKSESGKSYIAYRLCWHLHRAGWAVTLLDVPSLWEVIAYQPEERDTEERRAKAAKVLLLDDLGMESPSQGWVAALYRIIDARERAKLPTIVTTNRDEAWMRASYGDPLANRLIRLGPWVSAE